MSTRCNIIFAFLSYISLNCNSLLVPRYRRTISSNVNSKLLRNLGEVKISRNDLFRFEMSSNVEASTVTASKSLINFISYPILERIDKVESLIQPEEFVYILRNGTVLDAVQAMNAKNKGSVLILNSENELQGIFTERDFVSKVLDKQKSSSEVSIESVMTTVDKIVTASSDASLSECRQRMVENNIRHLPIMDKSTNAPLGVISMREIIRSLQQEDLLREQLKFSGNSLAQIQEQAKSRANELALTEGGTQDYLRAGFVFAAAGIGAALLQGSWIHDHEYLTMCGTFLLGYIGIVFENFFEFNKAGIALLMSTALWVIYAGTAGASGVAIGTALAELGEKVSEVSEVVFFILGAMTIVEIVDAHQGFKVVTDKINSTNKRGLMWVVGALTFFMSAILDNLTTTIVMVSLVKKLLPASIDRKLFGAMIVIAANAGGAWTPIGDVTTTMLWINGQISALPTLSGLLLPSIASVLVSIAILQQQIPAEEPVPIRKDQDTQLAPRGKLVFGAGIVGLLSVPVFKALTGLPPYLGMLAALGIMWSLTDAIHAGEGERREELMAPAALKKIDTSGVLFFLGILLSVGALDAAGILRSLAEVLDRSIPDVNLVATLIGVASALIDNVPLVAATMGMYSIGDVPMDSQLWQLIALCAGTGGSMLVIGSAAGVALMGLEKVDFVWYFKNISFAAFAGYLAGVGTYLLQHDVVGKIF